MTFTTWDVIQAAWRKSDDELNASYEKFAAEEGLV
jgi:hypothetical protein